MTIRDVQFSFTDTAAGATVSLNGQVAGTYLAPNSIDTAPLSASLSELTPGDTVLSANVNTYRDLGGGERLWLIVDWVAAPNNLTTVDVSLITSATSALGSPVTMFDFGAVALATLVKGYRQIIALPRATTWLEWLGLQYIIAGTTPTAGQFVAWIGKDVDAVDLGGASGFSIK